LSLAGEAAMSSSKFFKTDPMFIPIPLVRCTIAAPTTIEKSTVSASPSPLEPEPVTKAAQPAPPSPPEPQPSVDVEAIREEAYQRGMADQAAQDQANFLTACQSMADACQKLDKLRKELLQQSRGEIVNLIITLTQKIIAQELVTPRNIIAATLENALEQAIASEEFYVSLHPDDLAFAEEKAPEIIAAIRGLDRIVFETDKSITRGGCLVESKACLVDATVETQLESLKGLMEGEASIPPLAEGT